MRNVKDRSSLESRAINNKNAMSGPFNKAIKLIQALEHQTINTTTPQINILSLFPSELPRKMFVFALNYRFLGKWPSFNFLTTAQ